MIRCLLLAALLVACPPAVSGPEADSTILQAVAQRLEFHQGLQGAFTQEKHLDFMERPFVSQGEFTLDRGRGLAWHVTEPLDSMMVVRGAEVLLDGRVVADRGAGRLMAMIMLDFMDGDLSGIQHNFTAEGQLSDTGWQLNLVPSSRLLGAVLTRIGLRGDRFLNEIRIVEGSNTETIISLTDIRAAERVGGKAHAGGT